MSKERREKRGTAKRIGARLKELRLYQQREHHPPMREPARELVLVTRSQQQL
jgi:hypothetical protein